MKIGFRGTKLMPSDYTPNRQVALYGVVSSVLCINAVTLSIFFCQFCGIIKITGTESDTPNEMEEFSCNTHWTGSPTPKFSP